MKEAARASRSPPRDCHSSCGIRRSMAGNGGTDHARVFLAHTRRCSGLVRRAPPRRAARACGGGAHPGGTVLAGADLAGAPRAAARAILADRATPAPPKTFAAAPDFPRLPASGGGYQTHRRRGGEPGRRAGHPRHAGLRGQRGRAGAGPYGEPRRGVSGHVEAYRQGGNRRGADGTATLAASPHRRLQGASGGGWRSWRGPSHAACWLRTP